MHRRPARTDLHNRLARFLALMLLLQWGSVFLQCPPPAMAVQAIAICTGDGQQTLLLDENGKPLKADHAGVVHCPLCHLPAAVLPPTPSGTAPSRLVWYQVAQAPPSGAAPSARPRAPPQQPRAPPFI